jgi:hypothetical protein
MQRNPRKKQAFLAVGSAWPQIYLSLYLSIEIRAEQIVLLDLEPVFDRIDEERKFAPPLRVPFGGALHLSQSEIDAHAGEHLTGIFETKIAGLFHDRSPYSL